MAFIEPSLNHALAEVLNDLIRGWRVSAEQTGVFRGREHQGKQPDILFESQGDLPVVLENEYDPASSVEQEAIDRIGLVLDHSGQTIERVVALVSSADLKSCVSIADARVKLQEAQFRYALYSDDGRWPSDGYIEGTLHDLVWFLLNASKSTGALNKSIEVLTYYVNDIIDVLVAAIGKNKHTMQRIADVLKQDFSVNDQQPLGIVATVLVNAMVFQQRLAESIDVRNMDQMDIDRDLTQAGVIKEWDKILCINYWPIFSLARDLLYEINNARIATKVVKLVRDCAAELMTLGVVDSEDLSGVVFQRFMTDRKYLATFYTRPMSANLLAHLAIPNWNDPTRYRDFSMADFACGTGTLIYAAYQRLAVLQQLAKGEHPEESHSHMMENALHAADIVPSAAQLTASMLSSVFPSQTYEKSRVIVPQYGRVSDSEAQEIDDVRVGSLELLDEHLQGLIPEFDTEQQIAGRRSEQDRIEPLHIRDASQDVVIMNPPFTSAGSDWDHEGQHVKQYRGLGTTTAEQKLMSKRSSGFLDGTCYHGYAGLGSAFVAVADRMLKPNGTLAFVLPLSCAIGISWQKTRDLINKHYHGLVVVSIAADLDSERSFSADSDFPDILVAATRSEEPHADKCALFASLDHKPSSVLESYEIAKTILRENDHETLEDSITEGSPIEIGENRIGSTISVKARNLDVWNPVGIRQLALAQVAFHLSKGVLRLPTRQGARRIPICTVGEIATLSKNSANIVGAASAPFTKSRLTARPAYPMLWNHDKSRELHLLVEPDAQGRLKKGKEAKAAEITEVCSYAHFSRSTRTSQRLTACWTEEKVIGGRAWPNVKMRTKADEAAFVLWSNTTLGLLLHWYTGNRSQVLLADHTVSSFPDSPTLDTRNLDADQLKTALEIMEEFRTAELLPMNQAVDDAVRIELDTRVLVDMLRLPRTILPHLDLVREWWCCEPHVQGP